jgi:hypothetical protein
LPEISSLIVFRNQQHNEPVQGLITGIVSTAKKCLEGSNVDHETAVDLLIAFGELETGITDFVCRDADFSNDLTMQLRKTSLSAGRLFSCSWQNDRKGLSHWARDLLCNLDKLGNFDLPSVVNIRISEGYAYYGLYPETYLEAAEQFVRDFKPQNVLCIGLRSIGTS